MTDPTTSQAPVTDTVAVSREGELISRAVVLAITEAKVLERDAAGDHVSGMQAATAAVIHNAVLDLPAAPAVSAGDAVLREVMQYAVDLLLERAHGSPARSTAHNARIALETALRATPSPAVSAGDAGLDALKAEITSLEGRLALALSLADERDAAVSEITALRSQQAPAEVQVKPLVDAAKAVSRLWNNGCKDHSWRQHFDGAIDDLNAALIGGEA